MDSRSCKEAFARARRECGSLDGIRARACLEAAGLRTEAFDGSTECQRAGSSEPFHVKLREKNGVPQIVYGLPLHGNPTRTI